MRQEISINIPKCKEQVNQLNQVVNGLKLYESQLESVKNRISSLGAGYGTLTSVLNLVLDEVREERRSAVTLKEVLEQSIQLYIQTEAKISGMTVDTKINEYSEDCQNSNTTNENANTVDDTGDMSLEQAIDILNGISMSTSIDGVVLALVQYLLKLCEVAEASGLDKLGRQAGIVGLITGVAADIIYAMDNGSSVNALRADIIVDFVLWGVGEGVGKLGEAVGTAVGGPIGTIVGSFVGGLVGNGVSIAMNVDWNGEKEGGVGKDALSDWIDNQLDKVLDDREFEVAI